MLTRRPDGRRGSALALILCLCSSGCSGDLAGGDAMDAATDPMGDASGGDGDGDGDGDASPALDGEVDASQTSSAPPPICSPDGFCWELPTPQGETLHGAFASSDADVWAVGEQGLLLHYDGERFEAAEPVTQTTLYSVHGSASDDIWAVGDAGTVLHFDGEDWAAHDVAEVIDPSGDTQQATLYGVFARSSDAVFAVGYSGAAALALHFDGEAWSNLSTGLDSDRALRAVFGTPEGELWAVGEGGVIRAHDGTQWSAHNSRTNRDLFAVHGLVSHDVWAVGAEGTAVRFDGMQWSAVGSGLGTALYSVRVEIEAPAVSPDAGTQQEEEEEPLDAGVDAGPPPPPMGPWSVWAFGEQGRSFRYNGELWAELGSGTGLALHGAARLGGARFLAVGERGQLVEVDNDSRRVLSRGSRKNRLALWGDAEMLWAVGDEIARRDDAGWQAMERPSDRSLYGVFGDDRGIWAVGTAGTVVRYEDGELDLLDVNAAADAFLRSVWGAERSLWIVGHRGLTLVEAAGNFVEVETPVGSDLLDVWGDADDHFWAVGESGTVLRWDGSAWLQVPTGAMAELAQSLRSVWGSGREDVWVVGTEATILHWDGTRFSDHSRAERYSLNDVWGRSADDVYAVGTSGVALHYDGESWQELDTGTSRSLESVWGDPDGRVFAAGLDGTLLVRQD